MSETRNRPPNRRRSENIKRSTLGRTLFISVGRYPNGKPCEVFIDTSKSGSELRAIMHALAMMTSKALQHGCSIEEVIKTLGNFNQHELPHQIAQALREVCPHVEKVPA